MGNTNAPTESQSSQRNSTLYTISHPNTVIHSISRLPITTPALTTTRTILNSLKLPTTMASLPRIAPKPVETTTTQDTIKTEADDDHGNGDGDGGGGDGGGGGVPMYDLNQSQTVRVFPVNIGGESQDSSLLFPHTD